MLLHITGMTEIFLINFTIPTKGGDYIAHVAEHVSARHITFCCGSPLPTFEEARIEGLSRINTGLAKMVLMAMEKAK